MNSNIISLVRNNMDVYFGRLGNTLVVTTGTRYVEIYSKDIQGIGEDNQRWIIDRFDVAISERKLEESDGFAFVQPATYPEDWDLLIEEVIGKVYPLGDDSGRGMTIHHTVCDMHGLDGVTENAYRFAKKINLDLGLRSKFTLLRGERPNPGTNQPLTLMTTVDKTSKSGIVARATGVVDYCRVNTTIGKDIVASQLKRTDVGSGYIHFSHVLDPNVFDECTVEVRTARGWENPKRKRNEQTDLLCYGLANIKLVESKVYGKRIDWDKPPMFAAPWDVSDSVIDMADGQSKKEMTKQSDHAKLMQSRSSKR